MMLAKIMLMMTFAIVGLAANGQTWDDAMDGNGTVPPATVEVAKVIFPACQHEHEGDDWCYMDADAWNNRHGEGFVIVNGAHLIFDRN